VCSTQSLYWWVVANYDNRLAPNRTTWEFTIFQICAVCTSVTVQTFFAHRVHSLSANLYLGVLVQVLVLVQFGFGVATGVIMNMILDFEARFKEYRWVAMSWTTIRAVADIVIATCMCLVLRHRRTGFQKTNSAINRMILHTINTGLVTSVLSCIHLAMFSRYGLRFTALTIALPLNGFYSVTMLANLHVRKRLRARLETSSLEMINSSMKVRIRRKAEGRGNEEKLQATVINITREVVCDDVVIKIHVSPE